MHEQHKPAIYHMFHYTSSLVSPSFSSLHAIINHSHINKKQACIKWEKKKKSYNISITIWNDKNLKIQFSFEFLYQKISKTIRKKKNWMTQNQVIQNYRIFFQIILSTLSIFTSEQPKIIPTNGAKLEPNEAWICLVLIGS